MRVQIQISDIFQFSEICISLAEICIATFLQKPAHLHFPFSRWISVAASTTTVTWTQCHSLFYLPPRQIYVSSMSLLTFPRPLLFPPCSPPRAPEQPFLWPLPLRLRLKGGLSSCGRGFLHQLQSWFTYWKIGIRWSLDPLWERIFQLRESRDLSSDIY